MWLKLLCWVTRPLWLWKLEFNLNSGCFWGGGNGCIEYSSVVEYVFCMTRLLTFDCKLAVWISQWNKIFLKKKEWGLRDTQIHGSLHFGNLGIFFLYILYRPVLYIVHIIRIFLKAIRPAWRLFLHQTGRKFGAIRMCGRLLPMVYV